MGRVFSWEEIENKKIPKIHNFEKVFRFSNEVVSACEGIVGAIIYGSVLYKNTYNIRSDFDCLIIYDKDKKEETEEAIQKIFYLIETLNLFIPFELNLFDVFTAENGFHDIRPSFKYHLNLCAKRGGVIKRNPLEFISEENMDRTMDFRLYLARKIRKLREGRASLPPEKFFRLDLLGNNDYLFLQKMIEAPMHVARRFLWWKEKEGNMSDDSKTEVLTHYKKEVGDPPLTLLEELSKFDRIYSEKLEQQIENSNPEEYSDIIKWLAYDVSSKAIKFLEANAFLMHKSICSARVI